MKKFIITEEERSRILNMYKSRSSNQYLMEQSLKINFNEFPQVIQQFIKDNGLNENNFEWGNATKGAVNYKNESGKFFGLGNMQMFETDVNNYNQNKSNLSKCNERTKFFNDTFKNLMSGTNTQTQQDPKMQEHCKRYPQDSKCKNQGGEKMNRDQAMKEADELMNQKYPNMSWCGSVQKMQNLINF